MGAEKLHDAAVAERQRRIEAGIDDDVEDELTLSGPPLTTEALQGKRLEVCWGLYSVEGEAGRHKMWCPCKVLRVADGCSLKQARATMGSQSKRAPGTCCPRAHCW